MKIENKTVFCISLGFVVLLSAALILPIGITWNTAVKGLLFDIVGVVITFFRSLPSNSYEDGVCVGLEDGTEIAIEGKTMTVKQYRELQSERKKWHKYISWLGLACLCIGFIIQAVAASSKM